MTVLPSKNGSANFETKYVPITRKIEGMDHIITIGNVAANVISSTVNPDGTTTFVVRIPTNLTLTTQSCPAGGTAPQTTAFTVTSYGASSAAAARVKPATPAFEAA